MTQTDGGASTPGAVVEALSALVDAIQAAFPTAETRVVASLVGVIVLAAVVVAAREIGPRLKARTEDRDLLIESVRAVVVTSSVVAFGLFLVVVWRGVGLAVGVLPTDTITGRAVVRTVLTVGLLVLATVTTRLTKRGIRDFGRRNGALSDHQTEITHHVVQVGVYAVALLVVFTVWGVNPGNLLVGAGFAGIVLGLAARQTLGAVLAGFVVLFSRPFELGDWVVIGDQEGVVSDITIVNTRIRTFDEEYVMIPNDVVTDTEVVNRSRKGRLRLNLDVGVDYDTDVDRAAEVAEEAMRGHDLVMSAPNPHVVLTGFDDSSIGLRLRFYIDNPSARKMWKARTRVTLAVKRAFDEAGIKIPYPQRELSGRAETDGFRVAGGEELPTAQGSAANTQTDGGGADRGDDDA
ncbi:mechanosensitive ion channel family protein [Halobaculum lipolyticum]|uniref:Mechanosensitive ion channel family protein n=1 Tax=Halobaculum lipolyticum TaxID=3032001 RepID=A0ABD5W514_9EURY|nr:mechanosensitive ion channel family protein [Halobaculum sp. DT31]